MSYNLLLDTGFKKINKQWILTNCSYENGYLIGTDTIFAIELEIVLPNPTKLYFALDYICFDSNIKKIYCGILINDVLEVNSKIPKLHRRKRISVVDNSKSAEKIKVKFIIESKTPNSRIYIDSPLLIDLTYHNKDWWPRWMLNKVLDYRYGYDYENIYNGGSEISIDNQDFSSVTTKTDEGNVGIIAHVKKHDWFRLVHEFKANHYYLMKLDYELINNYGTIVAKYGQINSINIDDELLYIIFKANSLGDSLQIMLDNNLELTYLINLKHVLLVDITDMKIDDDDIAHLPFI